LSIANQIWNFISQGKFSADTDRVLRNLLFGILPEKLKNKNFQEHQGWYFIFWSLICPDPFFVENNPEKLLRDLRQNEKQKLADQVFLETVLCAINDNLANFPVKEEQRELVALGILITGMGWWEIAATEWNFLSKRQDVDVIEAVLKGMIAALGIDTRELAIDALWVLSTLKRPTSYDFNAIEIELQNKEIKDCSQGYESACQQLLEIAVNNKYCSLFHQIPEIPVNPKWELAEKKELEPRKLIRALEYPSEGVRHSAALLLLNGAGGDEGVNLVQKLLEDD
jgi:hypothetical protein